jgi:hypothetical protein
MVAGAAQAAVQIINIAVTPEIGKFEFDSLCDLPWHWLCTCEHLTNINVVKI